MSNSLTNQIRIKRLDSNEDGRDFVVGDLHGCLPDLIFLLKKVAFNESHDRLFSVGDLCDRGDYSMECLELMKRPWFHSVMGNHERGLLNYFEAIFMGFGNAENNALFCKDGGEWINKELKYYSVVSPRLFEVYRLLMDLPNLIVVGEDEKRFHVVHGELVTSNLITNKDIDSYFESLSNEDSETLTNNMTHGRRIHRKHLSLEEMPMMHSGLSKTFCGHSIVRRPLLTLSHCFIDTGCFMDEGYLSLVEVSNKELIHHGFKDRSARKGKV